jgi:hypothetical protein
MAIPDYQTLMPYLLKMAADGREHHIRDAIDNLATYLGLTEAERKELLPSGSDRVFDSRTRRARSTLKKAGLLGYPRRSYFKISERGQKLFADAPERIDVSYLKPFLKFDSTRLPSGEQMGKDQKVLLRMLQTIQHAIYTVVHTEPSILSSHLFRETWHEVEASFQTANTTLDTRKQFTRLYGRLGKAGLTGEMLRLKSTSLELHVNRFVDALSANQKGILTYPEKTWRERLVERLVKLARPAFGAMNSVLGSLSTVLPVLEIAKEYKEHVEITVEALGQEEPS